MDRVLAAVPVVTAWQSAQAKAKEGGYEFRVPKVQPRNPKNEPDALEARALKALAAGNLDEYHEIDHERNAVRYFRPIRLTQDCLLCHGSPSQSQGALGQCRGQGPHRHEDGRLARRRSPRGLRDRQVARRGRCPDRPYALDRRRRGDRVPGPRRAGVLPGRDALDHQPAAVHRGGLPQDRRGRSDAAPALGIAGRNRRTAAVGQPR